MYAIKICEVLALFAN